MTQRVRTDAHPRAARGNVSTNQAVDAPHGQPAAAIVHEERIATCPLPPLAIISQCSRGPAPARSRSAARLRRASLRRATPRLARAAGAPFLPANNCFTIRQVRPNRRRSARVERYKSLLPPLAED